MNVISVKKLSKTNRSDFDLFHCGDQDGWCHCVAWWVPTWENWGERTADQNKAFRENLFQKGEYDGYLLYLDGKIVGWCQCGLRDRLEKLCNQFNLESDPGIYAITCISIKTKYRGKGLAQTLLQEVLKDLKNHQVTRVQAFPKLGARLEPGEAWTGPESLYQKAGFQLERRGERMAVYGLSL